MDFEEFAKSVRNLSVIDTESLLTGVSKPESILVQLSRWQKARRLIQLRRGVYLLSDAYRKIEPSEFFLASVLEKPSYVSLQKALEFHGLIPEAVGIYTCITTKRPQRVKTPMGVFDYRHVKTTLFWGYNSVKFGKDIAFIASPEKALLDLFYFYSGRITQEYLSELRLQNIHSLNVRKLFAAARRFKKPKMLVAAKILIEYVREFKRGIRKV